MWTYQELALAADPVVVCGDDWIAWDQLAIGIVFVEFAGLQYQRRSSDGTRHVAVLEEWAKLALCREKLKQTKIVKTAPPSPCESGVKESLK